MVMAMSQEASEAKYTMEQMANIIGQFNETLEAEKLEKVPVLLSVSSLVTFDFEIHTILNMP